MMQNKLLIAKIGGNIIEDQTALDTFIKDFAAMEGPKILVHGGGKSATQLAAKLGVKTEMIDGPPKEGVIFLRVLSSREAWWGASK